MADKVSNRIPEWKLQAAIAAHLDKIGQPFAASLEGVKLNRYQSLMAAATGMKAGEPDIRLYFEAARTVFVELKGDGGRLNDDQKKRVPMLRGLGFTVHVVFADSEESAVAAIAEIVELERSGAGSGGLASASYFPKQRTGPLTTA